MPSDAFVEAQDRKASRYAQLETIAAWIVVAGVIAETSDAFFTLISHFTFPVARVAIGGFSVATGIVAEVWFSSRVSSAERKIRDRQAWRVAALYAETERLRSKNIELEGKLRHTRNRVLLADEISDLKNSITKFLGQNFIIFVANSDTDFDEHVLFALQLEGLLKSMGWLAIQDQLRERNPPDGFGVTAGFQAREAALSLTQALYQFGINTRLPVYNDGYRLDLLVVEIGPV